MIELVLTGSVPSKKNQRINTKAGKSFPSKAYSDWQDTAITDVKRQTRARLIKTASIEVIIYFATLGKADVDNRLTSILDMLVEALVLHDDNWQTVPLMKVQAEYRPRKPGAFIRLEELPADFLGAEYSAAAAKLAAKKRK